MTISQHAYRSLTGLCLIFFLLITGCSQKYQDAGSTIKEAFSAHRDVSITAEQIQTIPYASVFVNVNDKRKIFMVLAITELNPVTTNTKLKWMSADGAMIETENGYITKTLGFDNDNLAGLQQTAFPDFETPNNPKQTHSYDAIYDWMPGYRYGIPATVNRSRGAVETISTDLWKKEAVHFKESVSFPSLIDNGMIENEFWVDSKNQVIKSIQYLGPNMDKVEILFIKPYLATQA
ncbi:MAG: YjbF family lipoprotein [Marinomonas foliarum]|uniref:YjbF family lipoprotein n=1 Tax=Marinomonas foliarum TaxID=491950 RepID=UPI003F9E81A9